MRQPLIALGLSIAVAVIATTVLTTSVSAVSIFDGVNAAQGSNVPDTLFGGGGVITTIVNTLLFIAGALAVIMLIIGGFRYVVSGGNQTAVTAAKNTILYAIIGLIIAFFGYAIVAFIIDAMTGGSIGGGGSGWSDL